MQRERTAAHDRMAHQREDDMATLRAQALVDRTEIESVIERTAEKIEHTYARKDVLEHLVANMGQQVSFIATQVTEIRSEQRVLRETGLHRTRATDQVEDPQR